jgi:hypothetical protein
MTGPFRPNSNQRSWLSRGLAQSGGKLPLFDDSGRKVSVQTIRSCLAAGWAEPWFHNPTKPDWLVCRLTEAGRLAVGDTIETVENGRSDRI